MITTVNSYFTYAYNCLLVFTYVCTCLPMIIDFYLYWAMFTRVSLRLNLFTFVYVCLVVFTYVFFSQN